MARRELEDSQLSQMGARRPDGTPETLSNPGEEDRARAEQDKIEGRENAPLGYEQDVGAGDHDFPGIGKVRGAAPARGTPGHNPEFDDRNLAAEQDAEQAKADKAAERKSSRSKAVPVTKTVEKPVAEPVTVETTDKK